MQEKKDLEVAQQRIKQLEMEVKNKDMEVESKKRVALEIAVKIKDQEQFLQQQDKEIAELKAKKGYSEDDLRIIKEVKDQEIQELKQKLKDFEQEK